MKTSAVIVSRKVNNESRCGGFRSINMKLSMKKVIEQDIDELDEFIKKIMQ